MSLNYCLRPIDQFVADLVGGLKIALEPRGYRVVVRKHLVCAPELGGVGVEMTSIHAIVSGDT